MQVISAFISVFAYTGYAAKYEQAIRKSNCSTTSSVLLYLIAGLMILGLTVLTLPFCISSWTSFVLPNDLILWGNTLGINNTFANLVFSMTIMAIFYALHIWSEARARFSMDVGYYSILFQINILVIVTIKAFFEGKYFSVENSIGIVVVLLGSVIPLIIGKTDKITKEVIQISILSAVTAAVALFTDGEIVRQVIFKDNFSFEHSSLFLFYEALTFLLPCIIISFCLFIGNKKAFFTSFKNEIVCKEQKTRYIWSSLASALQFIFAVFALAIDPKSLLPIGILSITPILGVLSEKIIRKDKKIKHFEIIAAILVALGLILLRK